MIISIKDFEEGRYYFYQARQCGNRSRNKAILLAYLEAKEKGLDSFEIPELKLISVNISDI